MTPLRISEPGEITDTFRDWDAGNPHPEGSCPYCGATKPTVKHEVCSQRCADILGFGTKWQGCVVPVQFRKLAQPERFVLSGNAWQKQPEQKPSAPNPEWQTPSRRKSKRK